MKKGLILFIFLFLSSGGCHEKGQEDGSTRKLLPLPQPIPTKGWTGKTPPPQAPVVPLKKAEMPEPEPLYNPIGKPDPFQPVSTQLEAKGERKAKILPLEQFEINEFELVGIVSGSGIKKAMVQDMTGKGFLVQVGSRIGKKGGEVIRIADKEVIIEEPFQDFLGRKGVRKISLKMPQQ